MKNTLLKISLRQSAIFIPSEKRMENTKMDMNKTTSVLVANAAKLGYTFSEELLLSINSTTPAFKLEVIDYLREVAGVKKNWTPLVKEWNIPTGESIKDHIITFVANAINYKKGTRLQCGHLIPDNTFPLERYNGCPFCGTPFEFGEIEAFGQGSKLKVLDLWTGKELNEFYTDLLTSKTALDATQVDSLKILLEHLTIPKVEIGMKETLMLVIQSLVEQDKAEYAQALFKNPNDILRYLWYDHTGFLQIIQPKTIVKRKTANNAHIRRSADKSAAAKMAAKSELKLKYSRKECRRVATWINALALPVEKSCEIMHPKREMWVRFIRALRLAEYSKKKGFEKLASLLDVFYNENYEVPQARIEKYKLKYDADNTFKLLKQRPGLFARSLFANMLWFGDEITLSHFKEIMDEVPARLLFTLNMYADIYFDRNATRAVKPLGGINKNIPTNKYLRLYDDNQLKSMQKKIEELCLECMRRRFAKMDNDKHTMFIDEALFRIPVSIGDRSETVQDMPSALMGTRFPLEGSKVRLFMQWGEGLKAQHLDMDLSCQIAYEEEVDRCSYSRLKTKGCKHSGDILEIPNMVGTAEYIEIDVNKLSKLGAKYVSFTCNAYSNGAITPNLVVGWMDSKHPMKISKKSGVAYDPSCVQHQVRIVNSLSKGLVFGVLDVEAREIVWLEMSFGGQVVQNLSVAGVQALLRKLDSKLNIGSLLSIKAEAQGMKIVQDMEEAEECYDMKWARNTAGVTKLLVD